jgi:hypothetical protein
VAEQFGPRMSTIGGGMISVLATVIVAAMLVRSRGVRVRTYLHPGRLARMVA